MRRRKGTKEGDRGETQRQSANTGERRVPEGRGEGSLQDDKWKEEDLKRISATLRWKRRERGAETGQDLGAGERH